MAIEQYPNFDKIVFCYDFLKKTVFGSHVDRAHVEYLSYIPNKASVLIIGGGTGEILHKMSKFAAIDDITYLEYSEKMIVAAKKRMNSIQDASTNLFEISFVKGSLEMLNPAVKFDVVITPFVLDVIEPCRLPDFMQGIDAHMQPTGLWLFSDFRKPSSCNMVSYWHKALLRIMFIFFDLTTGLRGRELADFDIHFVNLRYSLRASKYFYGGLIQSKVWQKNSFQITTPYP